MAASPCGIHLAREGRLAKASLPLDASAFIADRPAFGDCLAPEMAADVLIAAKACRLRSTAPESIQTKVFDVLRLSPGKVQNPGATLDLIEQSLTPSEQKQQRLG
jgi:hypothetical protein